jgi:hypothetical protein
MNMASSMHHGTHIDTIKFIRNELQDTLSKVLQHYGNAVNQAYLDLGKNLDTNLCRNICVGFDGAWQK